MNAEIERLQSIIAQQDRQITLLVDRLDKADQTVQELRMRLQWALSELTSEPPHGFRPCNPKCGWCKQWDKASKAAWPERTSS